MIKFNENAEISLNTATTYTSSFLQSITDPFTKIFCDPWETKRNMAPLGSAIKQFTSLITN